MVINFPHRIYIKVVFINPSTHFLNLVDQLFFIKLTPANLLQTITFKIFIYLTILGY